jgi:hypothetical protein
VDRDLQERQGRRHLADAVVGSDPCEHCGGDVEDPRGGGEGAQEGEAGHYRLRKTMMVMSMIVQDFAPVL